MAYLVFPTSYFLFKVVFNACGLKYEEIAIRVSFFFSFSSSEISRRCRKDTVYEKIFYIIIHRISSPCMRCITDGMQWLVLMVFE